ncbi:MAG TPA: hypothetical protein VKT30_06815 [Caulobacteraceae bacterium]|nr:hypothetical protein [Caulobacteraceae bacterium]
MQTGRCRAIAAALAITLATAGCKPAGTGAASGEAPASGSVAPPAAAAASDQPVAQKIFVTIALSPAARQQIAQTGQTITLPVTFYGLPTDPALRAKLQGRLPVGPEQDVVINGAESVAILVPPMDPAKVAQVENGQVLVAIDVSSGNHTSQDNLLNCDPFMDVPLQQAEALPKTINCKLIGEP